MTQPPARAPELFGRRTLLLGALAAGLAGGGCHKGLSASSPPATVTTLAATDPFYIAHRGGGGDWPEMTGYAYEQAAKLPGLHALEISVCLSADGVLVCSHDATTKRTTGVDYTIAEQTWQTLSTLKVSAQSTTNPNQPGQPLTRFEDVVERYADRYVLYVEPKVPAAVARTLDRLAELNQPERVVWKQYINSTVFPAAKARGFSTWGYVLDEPSHRGANLARLAALPDIDMLGAPAESPALAREVVTAGRRNGKKIIMSVVRNDEDRARARQMGCSGLMASSIAELISKPAGG